MVDRVYVGTDLKFAINISSPGFDIEEDDFSIDIRRGPNLLHFDKEDLVEDENGQFYVCFDTRELGSGIVEAIITANVPDDDFEDGIRTEVIKLKLIRLEGV